MASYHLSPKTQTYTLCSAGQGRCPYGQRNHISEEGFRNLSKGNAYSRFANFTEAVPLKSGRTDGVEEAPVKVAPEGVDGIYCYSCKNYFPKPFVEKLMNATPQELLECPHCGTDTFLEACGVDIRHQDSKFLDDNIVKETSWFHVTTNPDWLTAMTEIGETPSEKPMLHIGSREAAMDRMRDLIKWQNDGSTWYLYELKVKPEVPVTEGVFIDDNDACPSTVGATRKTDYNGQGVNRYLNAYEAPGTISLVASPTTLREVTRLEVPTNN